MTSDLLIMVQNLDMQDNLDIIKAFAFDVDGVFTDGGIFCDLNGELFRTFDSKDGFALRMAAMRGYPMGVITGGRSPSIKARFLSCGIKPENVFLGSRDKMADFSAFCKRYSLSFEEVAYVGDDIPDLEVMKAAGMGVCPSDAVAEVKEVADLITEAKGGKGCIRELIEGVMKHQGTWIFDVKRYKSRF